MSSLVVIPAVWLVILAVAAVLIGRMVHLADLRIGSEPRAACEACALDGDPANHRCAVGGRRVPEVASVQP
jgi:hypothetical protein